MYLGGMKVEEGKGEKGREEKNRENDGGRKEAEKEGQEGKWHVLFMARSFSFLD